MSLQNQNRAKDEEQRMAGYKRIFPGANESRCLCSNVWGVHKGMLFFKFKMFL